MESQYNKKAGVPDGLQQLIDKHQKINKQIEEGKAIDPQLTENFVAFPLSNTANKG